MKVMQCSFAPVTPPPADNTDTHRHTHTNLAAAYRRVGRSSHWVEQRRRVLRNTLSRSLRLRAVRLQMQVAEWEREAGANGEQARAAVHLLRI